MTIYTLKSTLDVLFIQKVKKKTTYKCIFFNEELAKTKEKKNKIK